MKKQTSNYETSLGKVSYSIKLAAQASGGADTYIEFRLKRGGKPKTPTHEPLNAEP